MNGEVSERFRVGLCVWLFILAVLGLSGCANIKDTEYYENGQVKRQYEYDGFVPWSDGNNKNLPLSHLSVSGVGVGK